MYLLIVTGMSGAGKSTALDALEELGYYCVDNLPSPMLPAFVQMCAKANPPIERAAVTVDGRVSALLELIYGAGIPEDSVAEIVGAEKTAGCVVEWGATMTAPGVCELTSEPDSLSFHMGAMPGIDPTRLLTVKKLLEKMCPVQIESNLPGARWSKLLINATFSGLGTVMGGTFGDVTRNPRAKSLAVACMKEVIDVGHAAGVTFAPVQGKDIVRLFYWRSALKKAIAKMILPIAMKKHAAIEPSMLQDLKKNKPCEIDAINGVVCRWGQKYGIPTPINDRIVVLIHEIQDGKRKPSPELLNEF